MSKMSRVNVLRTVLAILIAFAITFIIIIFVSEQPLEAIGKMMFGPIKSVRLFGNVIDLMIPLIFTGVGVAIMFSANQINLGIEGSFHIGGLVGGVIALLLPLPSVIHPIVAIICGGIAGALITAIPALLKVKTNASVIVSSLMLNFIVLFFANYILNYYLRDPDAGAISSHLLPDTSKLIILFSGTSIHFGLIIALVVAVLGYLFLFKTKLGYMIRVTGQNQNFAKYAGINIVVVIIASQLIGGMIGGIGGAVQLLGMYRRFSWLVLLGYGWDAIIVTTLAKNNPLYVPFAAFFLAYLRVGTDIMARTTDVSPEIVSIVQAIIIVLIVAEKFLAKYKHRMVSKEAKALLEVKGAK